MCEVTDYFSSWLIAAPSAREPVKTMIVGGLALGCQLRASYCLITNLVWDFLAILE